MLRQGRMTSAQRRAIDRYWSRYGLDSERQLDLPEVFSRTAPRYLEIGFGMGDSLLALALAHPEHDYLGVEVYEPGIGRLLARLAEHELTNVRVLHADAAQVLEGSIEDEALAGMMVYFPDPWPKKRHHKRRLVQPSFAALAARKLEKGGEIYLATDWEDYARHMLKVLSAEPRLINLAGSGQFSPRSPQRPETKFERRGRSLGHRVWDLRFERG